MCVFAGYKAQFLETRNTEVRNKNPSVCLLSSPSFIFNFQIKHNISFSANHSLGSLNPTEPLRPRPIGLSQPFTVWLTEILEIQADGSSLWLMMSQADPFLCPLRSRSNPPQFPYVLYDKSHHAFQLTLLSSSYSFSACLPLSLDLGGL